MLDKVIATLAIGNSSQVKSFEYTDQGNMIVTFVKDTRYLYKSVPDTVFSSLVEAAEMEQSVGKLFNSLVKGKFEYIQLPTGETK